MVTIPESVVWGLVLTFVAQLAGNVVALAILTVRVNRAVQDIQDIRDWKHEFFNDEWPKFQLEVLTAIRRKD